MPRSTIITRRKSVRPWRRSAGRAANTDLSTKIWNLDHGYQRTLEAFEESVRRLQTQPGSTPLIHWPCPTKGLYQETWQALQKLYADGRVKAVGVSNFKVHHLEALKALGGVQPMVNQIEMHPYYIDDEMLEYAKKNNMVVEKRGAR